MEVKGENKKIDKCIFLKSKLRPEWVLLTVLICYQMENLTMQRTTKEINKYSCPTAERKESTWWRPCWWHVYSCSISEKLNTTY